MAVAVPSGEIAVALVAHSPSGGVDTQDAPGHAHHADALWSKKGDILTLYDQDVQGTVTDIDDTDTHATFTCECGPYRVTVQDFGMNAVISARLAEREKTARARHALITQPGKKYADIADVVGCSRGTVKDAADDVVRRWRTTVIDELEMQYVDPGFLDGGDW